MKIAGFCVRFSVRHPLLAELGANFLIPEQPCDFSIAPTEQELADEYKKAQTPGCAQREDVVEALACYRKFALSVYRYDAFVIHGAALSVNGEAVLFLAPSGTGKTTHLRLWQNLLGEKMTVINGDKPVVRLQDGVPFVFGTPFNGKEQYGCNASAPLRHLCMICRAEENRTEPLGNKEAVALLLRQTHIPAVPDAMTQAMDFLSKLLTACRVWKISCNMEPNAAETSYRTIFPQT